MMPFISAGRLVLEPEAACIIAASKDRLPPVAALEVPVDGPVDAFFEGHLRLPPELIADLARVDRITLVVARAVGNELDLLGIAGTVGPRLAPVERGADGTHHLDVLALR